MRYNRYMNPESINHAENSEQLNNSEHSKWDILAKYNEDERARVDKAKEKLFGNEEEAEIKSPSTLKKIGRSVLDLVGLEIPAIERKRNAEAEAIAIKEKNKERAEIEKKSAEEKAKLAEEGELRDIKTKLEDFTDVIKHEEQEKEQLSKDMVNARDYIEEQLYMAPRAQEIIERTVNASLVQMDDLEALATGEYEGVEKSSIEYGEKSIPVYNLKGYPCDILVSSVGYKISKKGDPTQSLGEDLAKKVIEDPSIWAKNKGEVEGGSLTICTSYVDLSVRPDAFVKNPPKYGFSKIRPNSVLQVTDGDGHSDAGRYEPVVSNIVSVAKEGIPMRLPDNPLSMGYNELTIKRYDDQGKPLLPDYIVTENGEITDIDKKHADYFKIPIVNIDQRYYKENNDGEQNGTTD